MKIRFLILLLLSQTVVLAADYSVRGKVIDSTSKQGLAYINILFENPADIYPQGAVTNDSGEFEITNIKQGRYTLVASGIGYERTERKVEVAGHISGLTIQLTETSFELDQVVVTATRGERLLKDVPIATQLISGKAIEQMQLSGFRDVLEYEMPGVEFTNNGGYSNINMLGFGGKYVLFLVDGERMAGESFDNIDYERIDMGNIERVEIVKGASSSLYGSNAIGGVINIITRKPKELLQIRANGRYGSNEEQQYNVWMGSRFKWGSFKLSGTYKSINPYLLKDRKQLVRVYDDGQVAKQALSETYIAGYTNYNITPQFTFNWGEKVDVELKGGYFFKERNKGGMDGRKVRDHFYDYTAGLKVGYKISDTQQVNATVAYDRYDKYEYFKLLDLEEKKYENTQYRAGALYNLCWLNKHSVVIGAEFLSDNLMTYMFESENGNDEHTAQTYSFFTQQEWLLHKKLTLITGLRFDYHSRFKGHLTPRLSLMYKVNDTFTIRGGYAGGFRSPTLKELYTDWFHPDGGGFQIIGNKDMKEEVSNNFNFSVEASMGKTLFTAMAQYSIIDNQVSTVSLNSDTVQYRNMGNSNVLSMEMAATHRFSKSVTAKATYAYVHNTPRRSSVVRPHSAVLRVDYTANFLPKYAPVISLSGKYFSGMDIYYSAFTTDATAADNEMGRSYKVAYEDYSIWRLTLHAPLPLRLAVNAGINNLFNYKPAFSDFYSSISPGRTFYIGLEWKLK